MIDAYSKSRGSKVSERVDIGKNIIQEVDNIGEFE